MHRVSPTPALPLFVPNNDTTTHVGGVAQTKPARVAHKSKILIDAPHLWLGKLRNQPLCESRGFWRLNEDRPLLSVRNAPRRGGFKFSPQARGVGQTTKLFATERP
eukprot:2447582-Lingulodinium_polyedra.AAC.1